MTKNKKKTAREKRILVGAFLTAAVIAAGSTFAWFTSTDEVTNRLSASADYNTTIYEDFTPEEDWTPGEEVKKEVGAINTGNVDSFVRMWLEGEMKLLAVDANGAVVNNAITYTDDNALVNANRTDLKNARLNGSTTTGEGDSAVKTYYREVKNTKATSDLENTTSERQTLQSGELVYAGGTYKYTANQPTGSKEQTGTAHTDGKVVKVDSESFTPTSAGLFIFRRNYDLTATDEIDNAEYSGYYFDGTHYWALQTETDGTVEGGQAKTAAKPFITVLKDKNTPSEITGAISNVKLFTATESLLTNDKLTWTYKAATDNDPFTTGTNYLEVHPTDGAAGLIINVELANIGTDADQWTEKDTSGRNITFYYNDDVEAGGNTKLLVKGVQLDKDVTQNTFISFDFDLNVNLESVQVTKNNEGVELATPVAAWAATTGKNITGANGAATNGSKEISEMTWSDYSAPSSEEATTESTTSDD